MQHGKATTADWSRSWYQVRMKDSTAFPSIRFLSRLKIMTVMPCKLLTEDILGPADHQDVGADTMTRARFPAIQGSWTQGVLSSGVCQTRASGTRRSQPVINALKATSNSAARVLLVARGSAGLGFTEVHAGRAQMRSVRHAPGSPEMPSLQQRGSHQIRTTAPGRAMLGTGSLVNLVCHVALQVALLVSTEGLVQWTLMHLALRATLVNSASGPFLSVHWKPKFAIGNAVLGTIKQQI